MKVLRRKKEFEEFYRDKSVVSLYDEKRLSSAKQRFVRETERFCALAEIPMDSDILEIGVGTGFISEVLATRGRLTGIDSSDAMLEAARKRLSDKQITLIKENVFELNLKKKFDRIVSVRVFLHFNEADSARALRILSSHLKPAGKIVFDFESRSVLKRFIGFLRRKKVAKEVENFQVSKQEIGKIVRKSGLQVESIWAIDHAWLLFPVFFLGDLTGNPMFERIAFSLDKKLRWLGQFNTRWFVVCKK